MLEKTYEAVVLAHSQVAGSHAVTGAWDLKSFLDNAKSYFKQIGGGVLMLMGVAALVWGGIQLVRKFMETPQNKGQSASWLMIGGLIIVGGAMCVGGWNLMFKLGSGGQKTITDMGGGAIVRTVDTPGGSLPGLTGLPGRG